MRTRLFFSLVLSIGFFVAAAQNVYAVPVRTYGSITPDYGKYVLKSENGGNGNLAPNSSANVDSYLFQCKSSGSAACSTEHNSDATLVSKWQNYVTVPALGGSSAEIRHTVGTLPYGQCGRLQYDQGVVGINGAIGGWVYDFGKNCPGATTGTTPETSTCSSQQNIDTQFRVSGNSGWISGNELTGANIKPGQNIDVNCFAKTGTALLPGGVIDVTPPGGSTYRVSNGPELRNFAIAQAGEYTFTCTSTTIASCSNVDRFSVFSTGTPAPTPRPTPTVNPTPSPVPTPSPTPNPLISSCESLIVVGGNDNLVPSKVTLRARGADNKGNIQAYRYYFGDGTRVETTDAEVTHEYTISGNFVASVDVKDSAGNYKSSNSCETNVRVRSSSLESYKNGCSDVFVTADNGAKAPSLVKFNISGYDNRGDIKGYKLDFGNGIVKESDGRSFEQRYDKSGTYPIRAYIKNSNGEWVGGTDTCNRSVVIGSTKPLTRQPSTGTPIAVPLLGLGSGAAGLVIEVARRKLRPSA